MKRKKKKLSKAICVFPSSKFETFIQLFVLSLISFHCTFLSDSHALFHTALPVARLLIYLFSKSQSQNVWAPQSSFNEPKDVISRCDNLNKENELLLLSSGPCLPDIIPCKNRLYANRFIKTIYYLTLAYRAAFPGLPLKPICKECGIVWKQHFHILNLLHW